MKKFCLALLFTLTSFSAWAELEVITLHHRSAAEILPVVRPLLDKNGVASGMNNRLILRTSSRNIAEIRRLLKQIDTPPRRLRITVLQNVDSATLQRLTEASGSVDVGNSGRVVVAPLDHGGGGGASAEIGSGDNQVRGRVYSTRGESSDHKRQQVTVLEGTRALIRTGQSVPVEQHQIVVSPWPQQGGAQTQYGQVTESRQYRDVTSGFYVLPRVSGDQVTLEVTAQNDALSGDASEGNPATRVQNVTTTVSGRLGEWLVLGDVSQQRDDDGNTVSAHTVSSSQERHNILLKVEELP